jgi:flagellar hook-associated protein 1 FlgK
LSLFGSLSLGGSSLATQQAALQVTGNNIANAGTAGYTRETVNITPNGSTEIGAGQSTGSGVTIGSVQRQVSEALNESLRDATSDQNSAQSLNTTLTSLQNAFGALNDNDLSTQLTSFFSDFSSLANDPTDTTARSQVLQDGQSIAQSLQTLQSQVTGVQQTTNQQVGTLAGQANSLVQAIAGLNQQISAGGASQTNTLQDQRDLDLSQLSQLVNITTVNQGNGQVNVLVGSTPIVDGSTTRGITSATTTNASGNVSTTLAFADNGDPINATGGQIGGLINAEQNYVSPALDTVNSIANGLIEAVNSVYSQGQGTSGYSSVTGTTQVADPTAPLNTTTAGTGLPSAVTNGTFTMYITNSATGLTTPEVIPVNVNGTGTPTTLNSLAASITAAGGGVITADGSSGQLVITSNNSNTTFSFGADGTTAANGSPNGADTSGVLAALGVNTFFSGSNASNIAVNSTLAANQSLLATARGSVANGNAQVLQAAGNASLASMGGNSVIGTYTDYIGGLAVQAQNASNNATAQGTIQSTLSAQQQSISGVSLDEETVNMMQFQRAFEGSARFITTVDELMQTVLGLIQ